MSTNVIPDTESCQELLKLPALASVDLKNNQIDDADNIVPFFSQLKNLSALYLKGNPGLRHISQYRKNLTANLDNLVQLDEIPISDVQRLMAQAWLRGGKDEEIRVRDEMAAEREAKRRFNREENQKLAEEGRKKRK